MQATAEWIDTDFYNVLGVEPTASKKEIRKAYRKLARTAHPDTNADDPTAEGRFSEIAKAYEVLSDDESRTEYDNLRLRAQQPSFGPGHSYDRWTTSASDGAGFDLGDLFGDYFAEQQTRPRRGQDVSASLSLDFVDAVQGLTTTLVVDGRNLGVRIPAGVDDHQTIRLNGKGAPGVNGGPPGDLLIQISVRPHQQFARNGKNLTVSVPLRYEDAVLGSSVEVPTLDGSTVKVRVPPGTASGSKLRVRGKGVPSKSGIGDLLVTVRITVPTKVTDHERALLEQLRDLAGAHTQ